MNIPNEAVEAAAKVMFEQITYPDAALAWEDIREDYCALMRPSLEAAAPHMHSCWADHLIDGMEPS